jgi:hypothetical protein
MDHCARRNHHGAYHRWSRCKTQRSMMYVKSNDENFEDVGDVEPRLTRSISCRPLKHVICTIRRLLRIKEASPRHSHNRGVETTNVSS